MAQRGHFKIKNHKSAVVAVFLAAAAAAVSRGDCATYTGSLLYSTGEYIFTQRTNSVSLFNGISFTLSFVDLSVSIPLIYQSSPWVSFNGYGMIPSGGTQHSQWQDIRRGGRSALLDTTHYSQFGIGDPTVHAEVALWSERGAFPSLGLTADVKPPVADSKHGFGTGEWDYAFGASLSERVGSIFLFADASYWILGDLPGLVLHDPVNYSFSVGRPSNNGKYTLMASLSGGTRVLDQVDPPMQIDGALSYHLSDRISLIGDLGFGLTESARDFAISVGWSVVL